MICPKCKSNIRDNSVICDSCDEILDLSCFEDDEEQESLEGNEGHTPPTGESLPLRGIEHRLRKRRDELKRRVAEKSRPAAESEQRVQAAEVEIDKAFKDFKRFYVDLELFDRLILLGVAALFTASFLPWKYLQSEGTLSGIELSGYLPMLAALVIGAGVVWRHSQSGKKYDKLLLAGQSALAILIVVFAVHYFLNAREEVQHLLQSGMIRLGAKDLLGHYAIDPSKFGPLFGLPCLIGAGGLTLLGCLGALLRKLVRT